jgi:hypothetical protein
MCGDKTMGGSSRHIFFNGQDEERTYPITSDTMERLYSRLGEKDSFVPLNKLIMEDEANAAPMAAEIDALCKELAFFLKIKNARYGNSALEPVQVFSNATPDEQINNRMDDKLKRIKNSDEHRMNDFVDLAGYIILKCLNNGWTDFSELLD